MKKLKKYTYSEIFQHWILVLLFVLLAISGFVQAKPLSGFGSFFINIFGNLHNVIEFHRILGILFILFFVIHLILISIHFVKGNRSLLITYRDFQQKESSSQNRFSLRHKLDYYAVFFGSIIFISTGLILIFPETASSIITSTGVTIAREIHFNEAIIASSVIIFWHMFYAHFHPEVFPINSNIFRSKKKS